MLKFNIKQIGILVSIEYRLAIQSTSAPSASHRTKIEYLLLDALLVAGLVIVDCRNLFAQRVPIRAQFCRIQIKKI